MHWKAVAAAMMIVGAGSVSRGDAPAASGPATAPATAPATRPTTGPALPSAEEMLKKLASDNWHERKMAQDQLVRLGEDAKPLVREVIRRAPDAESRKNAEAALAQIEENRITGPSFVSIHVKDAEPKEVMAELSRQCFAPLHTWPDNLWDQGQWPKITLDFDHAPFWTVMQQVCQKFGVNFQPFNNNGLRLMRGGMQVAGDTAIEGAFLIVAQQITYSRTRMFGQGQGEQTNFGINFFVYPEPKLTVVRSAGSIKLDEAADDLGNNLVPLGNNNQFFSGGYGWGGWGLYAQLQYPTKKKLGSRLVKFKGTTSFVVQTKMEKLEIANPMSLTAVNKVVNGTAVTIKELKKNGDGYDLKLTVNQNAAQGNVLGELTEQVQNRINLEDAQGTVFDHRGMGTSGSNQMLEISVNFGRPFRPDGRQAGEPTKLVWEIPIQTKEISVPIDFKNLPLFDDKNGGGH